MREENYIPDEEDVDVESAALIAVGENRLAVLDDKPKVVRQKLERALVSNAGAEVIRMIREEYRELVAIKLEMVTDEAVDTLSTIMAGGWMEPKTASAAEKAAEAVLDRAGFPKVSRRYINNGPDTSRDILPPLNELLANASPQEAGKITENYLEAIRRLDAMRHGAREIIDVRPGETDQATG